LFRSNVTANPKVSDCGQLQTLTLGFNIKCDIIKAVTLASNQKYEVRVGAGVFDHSRNQSLPLTTTPTIP